MNTVFGSILIILIGLLIYVISPIIPKLIQDTQNIICEKTGYGCPEILEIDFKELGLRDDDYYKKFSNKPFTGKVNGKEQGSLKNGNRRRFLG